MLTLVPQAPAAALIAMLAASGEDSAARSSAANDDGYRLASAVIGIYGYHTDAGGARLDAARNRYVLRFARDRLPPVDALWSIILYELPTNLIYSNPLNRYLIGSSMMSGLKYDADGGLSIYIQHPSPGKDKESNWLPAPAGPFRLDMRLYCAKSAAIGDRWKTPPALERVAEPEGGHHVHQGYRGEAGPGPSGLDPRRDPATRGFLPRVPGGRGARLGAAAPGLARGPRFAGDGS